MNLKCLKENHYVSDQLTISDFEKLAEKGIKSIINNRPDGEESEQPTSQELEHAAQFAGLEYVYVPIVSQTFTAEELEANNRALSSMSKPICGFCRTGTRSAIAWGLAASVCEHTETIVDVVTGAGFTTEALGKQLRQLKNNTLEN